MASRASSDWDIGHKSSLVSIGTHSLFVSVKGPDRKPGVPVILLFPGVTSSVLEWPVAIRLISTFARIVSYDRSGFSQSEVSPHKPSPNTIAAELRAVLLATGIKPPYVTLGHSWGGVLSSIFMAESPDDVAGMVLADPSAPDPKGLDNTPWKNPAVDAVIGKVDYMEVTGISKNHILSPGEFKAMNDEESSDAHGQQAKLEMAEVDDSFAPLLAKGIFTRQSPILGKKPVCVVKAHADQDFKSLYAAGVEAGNGTDEERTVFRKMLEGWEAMEQTSQKQYLKLSEKNHYIETKWCGHNLQVMEPEVIVDAVKWTLENLAS